MGFGHRVYRAEDPRARVLRRTAEELGSPAGRGRPGARAGRTRRAPREVPGPCPRDERRVLGRCRARHRRDSPAARARDVRVRAGRRLVGPHSRAEAHGPADPAGGALHRSRTAPGHRSQQVTEPAAAKKSVQLSGVVVAESAVSSIDPDAGVLIYRGYDIADLAEHSTYEETAYLLLHGELPSSEALEAFTRELAARELPEATAELDRPLCRHGRADGPAADGRIDPLVRAPRSGHDGPGSRPHGRDAPDRAAADGDRAPSSPAPGARARRARPDACLLRELPRDAVGRAAE